MFCLPPSIAHISGLFLYIGRLNSTANRQECLPSDLSNTKIYPDPSVDNKGTVSPDKGSNLKRYVRLRFACYSVILNYPPFAMTDKVSIVKVVLKVYLIHTRVRLKWDWLSLSYNPCGFYMHGTGKLFTFNLLDLCRRCCRHSISFIQKYILYS